MMIFSDTRVAQRLLAAIALLAMAGCGGGSGGSKQFSSSSAPASSSSSSVSSSSSSSAPSNGIDISLDLDTRYQTIDGFGGALPMWVRSANGMLTASELRTAVGMGDDQLGLSILRTKITPDANEWIYAVSNLQEAKSYGDGVQILASPWSPPAHMKDNNSLINGGKLLLDKYDDYANHLNDYVQFMLARGIEIDIVSIQNEPDWHPDYDSADWTGEELRNFVRDHAPKIQGTRILVGESLRFNRSYTDPTLNDPVAVNNMHYVGGHLYSAEEYGLLSPYPLAEQKGKPIWMTEWLSHEADGSGSNIWGDAENLAAWDETLDTMMRSVHLSMEANWNAYIWWWLRRFYSFIGDGEAAYGTVKGEVLKRGWAFSHYSKFVRPGHVRVKAEKSPRANNLEITAYQGEDNIVLVILNRSNSPVNDAVLDVPEGVQAIDVFRTSRTANRVASSLAFSEQKATLTIDARSVYTLVLSH